jgi:hypothetical protein
MTTACEDWPALAVGLKQMRRDGMQRSLHACLTTPEKVCANGQISFPDGST